MKKSQTRGQYQAGLEPTTKVECGKNRTVKQYQRLNSLLSFELPQCNTFLLVSGEIYYLVDANKYNRKLTRLENCRINFITEALQHKCSRTSRPSAMQSSHRFLPCVHCRHGRQDLRRNTEEQVRGCKRLPCVRCFIKLLMSTTVDPERAYHR